jgi:hypothetical protein
VTLIFPRSKAIAPADSSERSTWFTVGRAAPVSPATSSWVMTRSMPSTLVSSGTYCA